MNWMTVAWPVAIGACATMALFHLRTGLRATAGAAHLLFSLNAFLVACYAGFELALACADSPARYLAMMRWVDFFGAAQMVSTVLFVWAFFGTGRKWLACLVPALTGLALIADLFPQPKLLFLHLAVVKHIQTFGGATFTVAEGTRNPWTVWFYLGFLALILFVVDASVTLWRRGPRRRAVAVGGSIAAFYLAGAAHAALVDSGMLRMPYLFTFGYVAILVTMGVELSDDVLHAAQLAHDLIESEQRLDLAARAAGLGLWVWDIALDDIWVTAEGRRLYGVAPAERISYDRFAQSVHLDDRERVSQAVSRSLRGAGEFNAEYRVLVAAQPLRWVAARGSVEFNPAHQPILLRGVSVDITARKLAEAEAVRQRDELAHLSRVATVSELSGSLAHELNQPLAIILTNAQAARRLLAQSPPDLAEARDILDDIVTEDERAGEVIRRLRSLLKHGETSLQPLIVNEVIEEVLQLARSDHIRRGITLHRAFAEGLPLVLGDRVQLQQVLLNLMLNACDAMVATPPGGQRLVLTSARHGAAVRVSVSDTGKGLPPDPEQVFQPFFTTKPHGLGLGLSICRSIITAHKGRLWAEANAAGPAPAVGAAGPGATFHLELPVAPEAPT